MPESAATAYIQTSLFDDGRAACLLEWGPIQALLEPATVLVTARDLMAAATAAETDVALIEALRSDLKLDDQTLGFMLSAIRRRRPTPAGKAALRIAAVAGGKTGRPSVTVARGSMSGQLSPDEARDMALTWTEAATAAQIDVRLRCALGEWDHLDPTQIDDLFRLIQQTQR